MDSLVNAVRAADGFWPVLAIAIIGLYVLLYKFGAQILGLAKDSNGIAKHVAQSITTNHGSASIGEAVDKLTDLTLNNAEQIRLLRIDIASRTAYVDLELDRSARRLDGLEKES